MFEFLSFPFSACFFFCSSMTRNSVAFEGSTILYTGTGEGWYIRRLPSGAGRFRGFPSPVLTHHAARPIQWQVRLNIPSILRSRRFWQHRHTCSIGERRCPFREVLERSQAMQVVGSEFWPFSEPIILSNTTSLPVNSNRINGSLPRQVSVVRVQALERQGGYIVIFQIEDQVTASVNHSARFKT